MLRDSATICAEIPPNTVSCRRMYREARSPSNQGDTEGSVFAKATPGQGVLTRLLVTA